VSDCHPALDSLFDTCVRSEQIFSLDACHVIRLWLELDKSHSISLWFVPSKLEWRAQKVAHDLAVSLRIGVGVQPRTSLDYLRQQLDVASESAWHWSFTDSAYQGRNFLDLKGSKGKPALPTTHKGGPFLSEGSSIRMFARFCRCTMGHAPIGEYCSHFNIDGPVNCDCGLGVLETRRHILGQCSKVTRSRQRKPIDSVGRLNTFLDKNTWAFAFLDTLHIVWDPG
jgi:hypothetical protein